ncbi:glyoxylate/hydroxypyruvate reductase A [soil metagenome]
MSILLISKTRDMKPFRDALLNLDNNLDVDIWPAIKSKERVNFAVAWNHPKDQFNQFPNLKVISSLGAGVDHLLNDKSIGEHVILTRVVASNLTEQMCDYVTMSVLNMLRQTQKYYHQQIRADWNPCNQLSKENVSVGVMGLGKIGKSVAIRLADNEFKVSGWSKSKKTILGIKTYKEDELNTFLAGTNILVCLLPLTSETDGILNLDLFKKLDKPAFLLNAARGEHLVEEDLLYALDMNLLNYAVLDVFQKEPLPGSHPFWGRDRITITPHIASLTDPAEIAELLLDNYKRMLSGQNLLNKANLKKGY